MLKYLLIGSLLFFLNCAKTDYYTRSADNKVRFNSFSEEEGYKLKKRFEVSHTRINLFWGLANVYKKDLELILFPEFRNPEKEAVGNLSITESYDFVDSLIDFILIGLVRPYTIVVKGDLYERNSQSLKSLDEERSLKNGDAANDNGSKKKEEDRNAKKK